MQTTIAVGYMQDIYSYVIVDGTDVTYTGIYAQNVKNLVSDMMKHPIAEKQTEAETVLGLPKRLRDYWWAYQVGKNKFNPYHDPHSGRFTSGSAVGSQLAESLAANEGFTYNPFTRKAPSTGLALSIYPEESKIIDAHTITGKDIFDYVHNHAKMLQEKGNYCGAWWDKESGRVFLDISKVVDDPKVAEELCRQHGQRAYFDLGKMQEVRVLSEEEAHKGAKKTKVALIIIPGDVTEQEADEIAKRIRDGQATYDNQKFNPYHDPHSGRFTTGGAYGSFSMLDRGDQDKIIARMANAGITMDTTIARGSQYIETAKFIHEKVWQKATGTLTDDASWYERANGLTTGLAKKFGLSTETTAAVIAALSPRVQWDGVNKNGKVIFPNVKDAYILLKAHQTDMSFTFTPEIVAHFKTMDKTGYYTRIAQFDNVINKTMKFSEMSPIQAGYALSAYMHAFPASSAKALRILRGESPDSVLGGAKVRSFFDNLINPKGVDAVTIDTWMVRILSGSTGTPRELAHLIGSPQGGKLKGIGSYPFFAEAVRKIAEKYHLTPAQAQAVIWSTSRREAQK